MTGKLITYACAVRGGHEYEVEEALREVATWALCVREVHAFTPPNTKRPVAAERPLWPGYVFARMDGDGFFHAKKIKHLHPIKLALTEKADGTDEVKMLHRAIASVEASNARVRRMIEAGDMVTDLAEGDRVEILSGPFANRLASFARVIKRADDSYDLSVTFDGMALPVSIQAADVRRIA